MGIGLRGTLRLQSTTCDALAKALTALPPFTTTLERMRCCMQLASLVMLEVAPAVGTSRATLHTTDGGQCGNGCCLNGPDILRFQAGANTHSAATATAVVEDERK